MWNPGNQNNRLFHSAAGLEDALETQNPAPNGLVHSSEKQPSPARLSNSHKSEVLYIL